MAAARVILLVSLLALAAPAAAGYSKWRHRWRNDAEVGYRPEFLVSRMDDSDLKTELEACDVDMTQHKFSIGHRGACLQYPEHTRESYEAATKQGAGIIECDVTFTKDRELVCRHAQCDLHTTTNILATDLAAKCTSPFVPADAAAGTDATATCCTSDITLAEFRTLCGKMDASDASATTVEEYLGGTANFRTDLYSSCGTLMTHAESIKLIDGLGAKFTPELKSPSVEMPFEGDYTQENYAQQMIDEYKASGIEPAKVWAQSFNLADVEYWIAAEPEFGEQAVFLEDRFDEGVEDPNDPTTWSVQMADLVAKGVEVVAPPMWVLVTLEDGVIVPSNYAHEANAAGLDIITWTLERSGLLTDGGGYYYQSVADAILKDADMLTMLDVLARDVGVIGVFTDWPATVTHYANCVLDFLD
ncbi:glycerophosphoryl diester phosphodiesterase [Ectocarpus siliculosus]|uniref:glycerophosphodiester phosphodiesterase n=1 Tax=Ectocarpus siliculosus TaxID=2880 RepID=D8LEK2_ECTSI|nr:glycerophosphoryl diester phosphodiesterase [Ectocarpus siliculosus]|eukprot:CBN78565.1 glycerophosphoryl diester phosphodiesterase [Ectocarpus siliculosus]